MSEMILAIFLTYVAVSMIAGFIWCAFDAAILGFRGPWWPMHVLLLPPFFLLMLALAAGLVWQIWA